MEAHDSSQTDDSCWLLLGGLQDSGQGPLSAASTVSSRTTSPGVQAGVAHGLHSGHSGQKQGPAQQPPSWENEEWFQRLIERDPCFKKAAAARERGEPLVQLNNLGLLEGFMEALFKVLADVQVR